ncbi:MAG: MOSC domain-containing protein, partial [Microcoleaceae cyanobacterium]
DENLDKNLTDINWQENQVVNWLSKKYFAVQNDWPGLACLQCDYQHSTGFFRVKQGGILVLEADLRSLEQRKKVDQFFTNYLQTLTPNPGARHPQIAPVKLVGDGFTSRYPDRNVHHISLIGQGTLDELSRKIGEPVSAERFRANFVIAGLPAWQEFQWLEQPLFLGEVKIQVTAKIGRCLNIEVNPLTGARDLALLKLLKTEYDHTDTGILATVETSGEVGINDHLKLIDS